MARDLIGLSTYVDYITLKHGYSDKALIECLSAYVDYITLKPTIQQ